MTLEELNMRRAYMLEAEKEYKRAEPDVVHHAAAEFKAARFEFNRAAGEYVSELLEKEE